MPKGERTFWTEPHGANMKIRRDSGCNFPVAAIAPQVSCETSLEVAPNTELLVPRMIPSDSMCVGPKVNQCQRHGEMSQVSSLITSPATNFSNLQHTIRTTSSSNYLQATSFCSYFLLIFEANSVETLNSLNHNSSKTQSEMATRKDKKLPNNDLKKNWDVSMRSDCSCCMSLMRTGTEQRKQQNMC